MKCGWPLLAVVSLAPVVYPGKSKVLCRPASPHPSGDSLPVLTLRRVSLERSHALACVWLLHPFLLQQCRKAGMAQGPHPCMEQPSGCPPDSGIPNWNSSLPVCSSLIFVLVVIHFLHHLLPKHELFSPLHQSHVFCLSPLSASLS